ncbi:MAG TPA: glycosyl hydrolase family 8 [Polyangiaceae bacterium]|nr:glycosyl hydrolase family 8 [Polyangiaceae bacterium]
MRKKSIGVICCLGLGVVATAWGCTTRDPETQQTPLENGGADSVQGGASFSDTDGGENAGGTSASKKSSKTNTGGTKASSSVTGKGGTSSTRGGSSASGGTNSSSTQAGSASGGTSASSTTSGPSRGPTPKSATANFPFPQNRFSANCTYPDGFKNEDVQSVYEQWKTHLVTSDGAGGFRRVKRPDEPGLDKDSTVSEGIAYGMIIAVYMDDQALFDDLWRYALLHSSSEPYPGTGPTILMNWYILASGEIGKNPGGGGAATDADEDMAWALIMADKQWGGKGKLEKSYLDYAKQLLGDIWKYEILDSKLPKNGSGWGGWDNLNVSYFAPSYYRVFATVSGQAAWKSAVVDTIYDVIDGNLTAENGNQANGLVPAFSSSKGGVAYNSDGSELKHFHQYDSCRTPFRIGLDACQFNEPRAKTYLAKISKFYSEKGAANILDGYKLDGTNYPEPETKDRGFQGRSAAFIGPAGVGAMHDPTYQPFIEDVWELLRQNNMWHGGQYYDESWTILSMLMLSGNFLDYTAETPLTE